MSTATPSTDMGLQSVTLIASTPTLAEPTPKRWTREQYYQFDELGYFQGQRVELVDGEIFVMSPQSFGHYWSMDTVADLLREVFDDDYWVRMQAPCHPDDWSEPEPDVSVVKGNKREFQDHPSTAALVVEVAKTSLSFDRGKKLSLYAAMDVTEYWVLDLVNRQLIVHRQPVADEAAPMGHRYESIETIAHDGEVSPLEMPEAKLSVAAMLPPMKESDSELPREA